MKTFKILFSLLLAVALLFAIDFLGFYPVGKTALSLLEQTPLRGPIKTWQLGSSRQEELQAERALIEAEQAQLKKKEQDLLAEKEEIQAQRLRLTREAEQTAELVFQLQKQENDEAQQKEHEQHITRHAALITRMKPKQAAAVLAELDLNSARKVLGKIEPRVAARILEQMAPQMAVEVLPE